MPINLSLSLSRSLPEPLMTYELYKEFIVPASKVFVLALTIIKQYSINYSTNAMKLQYVHVGELMICETLKRG